MTIHAESRRLQNHVGLGGEELLIVHNAMLRGVFFTSDRAARYVYYKLGSAVSG